MASETLAIHGERRPPPGRALADLAAGQWGVVSVKQLRALGLGRGAIEHRVRVGELHRVHRGVYAVGHKRLAREGRRLAAVLACGDGAVLSHRSAASHWGLLATSQSHVDVTARRGRRGAPGIRLHSARSLDAQDTTVHEEIPTTTIARTLLDLAATVRPDRLERALAQAEILRLYDHAAVEEVIARGNGHRGARRLADATAREPKLTRSEFEARFLQQLREAGLPEPLVNHELHIPDHGLAKVDYYWPASRLVVETDGWETHRTRAAFESDRARDAALTAAGCRVMRFTWRADPAIAVRRVRAAL